MTFKLKGLVITCAAMGALTCAKAGVNVNNGNFYIAYTDFLVPTPGLNIDITRTYNSRSSYVRGIFGVGQSSEVEGYLSFDKTTVLYNEGGGSNVVKFEPVKGQADVWYNGVYGVQRIKKSKDGNYVLESASGKFLGFNAKGQMSRISDRNKNFIELVYDQGRLGMLRDNFNNQVKFRWGTFGNLPRVTSVEMGDKKARYEYNNFGDLAKAWGADGIPYEYSYDDEHNMTRISYKDGSYKEMGYNKAKDWITSFRDQDKTTTGYEYISDNLDPENKFGTVVTRTVEGKPERDVSRFWYEFRRRADGSKYNYRAITSIRNNVTETIFTECCGTPQAISQWKLDEAQAAKSSMAWIAPSADKRSTFFEYYPEGLLKKKTAPDGVSTVLTYDARNGKVATVDRGGKKIQYNYDGRGNLAWAFDADQKKRLDLTYDEKGRITIVQEALQASNAAPAGAQSRKVFFRYDAAGKPVEIKEQLANAAPGTVKFTYGPAGDIIGVFNADGRPIATPKEVETAQRISSTFQGLLQIVQPAGVTLTPEG